MNSEFLLYFLAFVLCSLLVAWMIGIERKSNEETLRRYNMLGPGLSREELKLYRIIEAKDGGYWAQNHHGTFGWECITSKGNDTDPYDFAVKYQAPQKSLDEARALVRTHIAHQRIKNSEL